MQRVVLDTNVIISAFISPNGNAAQILRMATDEQIRIYYAADILAEYTEVLSRPRFNFSFTDIKSFTVGIEKFGILIEPVASVIKFVDETDRIFYDVANFCEANLITGNIKHYPRELFVVTPAEFLLLTRS